MEQSLSQFPLKVLQLMPLISRPKFWHCGSRGYRAASRKYSGPIVISGISGRFPKANNTKELNEKLLKGEELTSETTSRWTDEQLPKKYGFLNCLDKFDANFFNLRPRQAHQTDPQIRLLLEAAFEAIVDAGLNPTDLRGSDTGVFCGAYGGEALDYRHFHFNRDNEGYHHVASSNFMIPARIAFGLDLQGPSTHVSTACSSSLTALEIALNSIEAGKCEAAIVTGSTVHLNPFDSKDFLAMNVMALDSRCKTFDESGDGFVRSEAAVAILIQKEKNANRSYARIKGLRSNSDGFKHAGLMHPTSATQQVLFEKAYEEAGVDPAMVSYFEAHGTGTPVGDPEEVRAIHRVFCEGKRREGPLLIGSVKTNLGHTEGAAGLCAVAKVIGIIQSGTIPGNLFFNKPNPEIKSLFDGSLKVVTEATAFEGGMIGITSMGIGGTNCHLILESGPKTLDTGKSNSIIPILLPLSGRSETLVEESIAEANDHADNPEFVYLLQKAFERNIPGHTSRGFGLCDPGNKKKHIEVARCESVTRPVWVVFPGMGSQWSGMGQDLLKIEPFAESIHRSRMTLRNLGVDLDKLLRHENQSIFTDIQDAFMAITVMQIGLWDVLKELKIKPDGFIGHSVGECLCAYADGCYTAEETLQIIHARGRAMKETQKVDGGMSSIGMSANEIKSRLPPGIEIACYNSANNVAISGDYHLLTSFTKKIKDEGRFAVGISTCGTAAHSSYVREAAALLKSYAQDIIQGDRPRSSKWISTSIPEAEWGSSLAQCASPEYIENNVFQPVLFHQALQHVQAGSVVIEVSPKGFFQALLAETVPSDCRHVAPMTAKADDKLWHFCQSIGQLYSSGVDVELCKLYPSVSTPVSCNVPSLSHLVRWDHTASWKTSVLDFPLDITYESVIDIEHPSFAYLAGHRVDNRILMPATGLLCGVWNQLGDISGRDYESFPVQFQNVILKRATTLSPGVESTLVYKMDSDTGAFSVKNQGDIIVTGKVEMLRGEKVKGTEEHWIPKESSDLVLSREDTYKVLKLNGYNYTGMFQSIEAMDSKGRWADISWHGNWTCFLDSMLQTMCFCSNVRHLALPVDFEMITIDPVAFKRHLQRTFEETGSNVVRVLTLPNQKKIIAPGIEVKGLELRQVPRILRRGNLAYERHTFCPFVKDSTDPVTALEEMLDLVLVNNQSKHLEVTDIFTKKEHSFAPEFQRILSRKPWNESTITMVTLNSEAEMLEDVAKVGSVLGRENKRSLAPQVPTDLVFLDDHLLLEFVLPMVKANGFVLVHSADEQILNEELIGLQRCSTRVAKGITLALYRKVELDIPEIVHVSVDAPDFAWVPELQKAIGNSEGRKCKIFVTSQRDCETGILGLVNCLREEDGGERIRCIFDPQGQLSLNFKEPDLVLRSIILNDLFVNVHKNGILGSYRHVSFSENEHRETSNTANEAFVGPLTPADLSSLRWIESPLLKEDFTPLHPSSASAHDPPLKRYKVAYAPMNFRDVLLATTTVPLQPEDSYSGSYLGFEFSGFDPDGKRVMGFCRGSGLATSLITDSRFVWPVPNDWTLEEAATVPIVYATVLSAFHTRARLQPGQTVLVHSGTGGVGHAAISVALAHGCRVFTTVGTPEKRDYMKRIFPEITDDYIGNSRDTSFEADVMEITEGRGVDVALNSLSGDKLLATLRCVAVDGTFVEIGVFDAYMNTQIGLRPFLKNINFCCPELIHVFENKRGYDQTLRQLMENGIRSGAVQPLPKRVFECGQLEEAFRFMASGKHIGKLVFKIRDDSSDWKEPLSLPPVIKRSYFSAHKTYVVVGGLGGFGLEVAGWMVERGVRKIVLNSRSGVTNAYQEFCLRRWREAGVEIHTPTVDLSDPLVANLFIKKMLARGDVIGGVINSALSLRDQEFSKQTIADFQQVSKPKASVTKILDDITRRLCPDLDFFVVFSSLSCGRGNADQSNYGWANSSMERICEKRKEDGFHGLAIQWGILGEVGVVAEKLMKGMEDKFELRGTQAQSLQSCLEVLDAALQQPFPVVSSCVLAEKRAKRGERLGILFRMEKMFGITDLGAIPPEKKLSELGLDSLIAVELRQTLEREHEISITKEHLLLLTVGDIKSIDAGTFDASKMRKFEGTQEIYVPFKLHKTSLVLLKSHQSDRHAFIIYGSDGGCEPFEPLASRMNANVFGFNFTGQDGWNSIPELAMRYADEIKGKGLNGPCMIMGFSAGTAIAFEVAQRLRKSGEIVQNLVFLDGCPSYEKQNLSRTLVFELLDSMNVLRNLSQDSIESFKSSLTGDVGHDSLEAFNILKAATGYELTKEAAEAYAFLTQQLANHVPSEEYDGNVILIQAADPSIDIFAHSHDYDVGRFCTGEVIRHKVTGNHLSFLDVENVHETASIVNDFLR